MRQTPRLTETQKKRVAPLAFLHAAGHLCTLGVLGAGSLAVTQVFQVRDIVGLQQYVVAWMRRAINSWFTVAVFFCFVLLSVYESLAIHASTGLFFETGPCVPLLGVPTLFGPF